MRWLRSLPFFLGQALAGMRQNPGVSALAVGTTAVALLILGAFWLVLVNLSGLVEGWGERFQVAVYLRDDAGAKERRAVERMIRREPLVGRLRYISKKEALREFRKRLGEDSAILEGLVKNPLPASYRARFRDGADRGERMAALARRLAAAPGVERVVYDRQWLRKLEDAIGLIRLAAGVLSAVFGLGVVFIISNTIRLTLYARQEEIAIMHLVGATEGFIRTPFVLEGMIHGALGALVALAGAAGGYYLLLLPGVELVLGGAVELRFFGRELALGMVGGGALLGALGSFLSLGRFLRDIGA
ncbi:MAG: permease-like cell division protein FtsX [Nitrospinota bacterium]